MHVYANHKIRVKLLLSGVFYTVGGLYGERLSDGPVVAYFGVFVLAALLVLVAIRYRNGIYSLGLFALIGAISQLLLLSLPRAAAALLDLTSAILALSSKSARQVDS